MKKSRPTVKLILGDDIPALPAECRLIMKNSTPTLQVILDQNIPEVERWKNRALTGEWAFKHNQNVKKEEKDKFTGAGRQSQTDAKEARREALRKFAIEEHKWDDKTPVALKKCNAILNAFTNKYPQHKKDKKTLKADAVAIVLYLTKPA